MNRIVRSIAAVALAAASLPALAFVRETTTPGNPATGVCLWWNTREVRYTISNAMTSTRIPCDSMDTAQAAITEGLNGWAAAATSCSDFTFAPAATPVTSARAIGADGVNLIVLRSGRCINDFACSGAKGSCSAQHNCWEYDQNIRGLTTTSFNSQTGEITDADVELFAWDGKVPPFGAFFTCNEAPRCGFPFNNIPTELCSYDDLVSVVRHEAGHMLGLDHVCSTNASDPPAYRTCTDPAAIMKPTVGVFTERALAQDDVNGICTIYPRGAATLKCASTTPDNNDSGGGGGGCSTVGGSSVFGLLIAAFAVWRGNRRNT